jgi:PhnB protein
MTVSAFRGNSTCNKGEKIMAVKPIPDGYTTVTPYLIVEGAAELINFLKETFGATQRGDVMPAPEGKIGYAELEIGNSVVMISEAQGELKPTTTTLHVYVSDVDATYKHALELGAVSVKEPKNEFYGDRAGNVRDKWGNHWSIATHVEDVS